MEKLIYVCKYFLYFAYVNASFLKTINGNANLAGEQERTKWECEQVWQFSLNKFLNHIFKTLKTVLKICFFVV